MSLLDDEPVVVADPGDRPRRLHRPRSRFWVAFLLLTLTVVAAVFTAGLLTGGGHAHPVVPPAPAAAVPPGPAYQPGGPDLAGFPQTPAGATGAALNIAGRFADPALYLDTARPGILAGLVLPGSPLTAKTTAVVGQAAQALGVDPTTGRTPAGPLVSRWTPQGVAPVTVTGPTATVRVWSMTITGVAGAQSTTPPQQTWTVDSLRLVWQDGRWWLDGYDSTPGPVPVGGGLRPSAPEVLADAFALYQPVGYGA